MNAPYSTDGFTLLPACCSPEKAAALVAQIHRRLDQCAAQLDCTKQAYLEAVSRWVAPSPVTRDLEAFVTCQLKPQIEAVMGESLELVKTNVISKSAYAFGAVPCHQDIAYSPHNPYECSVWLALNPVSIGSGVMEVLPKSHLGPIEPAIDFWAPDFVDNKRNSHTWREQAVTLPIEAGEAILFDARLWHGSRPSNEKRDRFALVTRWRHPHFQPSQPIPSIEPAPYGMWTCQVAAESILRQYFPDDPPDSFVTLLDAWIERWQGDPAPLQRVKLLHRAAHLHNGGDAHGTLYAELWRHILLPLQRNR